MLVDKTCKDIGDYLKIKLNELGQENLNMTLVKTVQYYDSFLQPNIDYPLLKVFRNSDLFFPNSQKQQTQIIIRYCLSYEEISQIAPLCGILAKFINNSLNVLFSKVGVEIKNSPKRSEFRTLYNENTTAIYAFLNFYFEIEESSSNYKDWII